MFRASGLDAHTEERVQVGRTGARTEPWNTPVFITWEEEKETFINQSLKRDGNQESVAS